MPSETEIAWAAGFFDGEGCIRSKSNGYGSPMFSIGQKDRRPLERFARIVEGKVIGPYGPGGMHFVQFTRRSEIVRVMRLLFPFLSEPKQEDVQRVLNTVEDTNYWKQAIASAKGN